MEKYGSMATMAYAALRWRYDGYGIFQPGINVQLHSRVVANCSEDGQIYHRAIM
jgi:hypothetical protein